MLKNSYSCCSEQFDWLGFVCFQYSKINNNHTSSNGRGLTSPSFDDERSKTPPASSPPPLKRLCKRSDSPQNSSPVPPVSAGTANTPRTRPLIEPQVQLECYKDLDIVEVRYLHTPKFVIWFQLQSLCLTFFY